MEPFHAYHHQKTLTFFPPPLPEEVLILLKNGEVKLLKADLLNSRDISLRAADKAVQVIEPVYEVYRREYQKLFQFVSDTLKSSSAENAFKKNLCNKLAEFYSVNILLARIEDCLESESIHVFPDTNIGQYLYLKSLVTRCRQDLAEHRNIRFPFRMRARSYIENFKHNIVALTMLSAQTAASGLFAFFTSKRRTERKSYTYCVSIIAPNRQLRGNQRGPDFIIDGDKIQAKDVVYLPMVKLDSRQKELLKKTKGDVYYPPDRGRFFSNFTEWSRLLRLVTGGVFSQKCEETKAASNIFFNYFAWTAVMRGLSFKHFITHSDFSLNHIGRNIAIDQAGAQTWYFTDSMNFGNNFSEDKDGYGMRHPFWSYLTYDHFVTWDKLLEEYFRSHPGSFKKIHVAGCLWSGHIKAISKKDVFCGELYLINLDNTFIVSAFDSTYSRNGITSYAEGIAFAEHLLQLADECSDIHIYLKEKKDRSIHGRLDPVLGPRLLDLYNKMDTHARITICSNDVDASRLISASDMTISFPFTSTTFEALSADRPALWHDPKGYYINTPYAKNGGVTTHRYEALKEKVLDIINTKPGKYKNPININSPLSDPYRDGKAIDRFRGLLTSDSGY
ncbi:MAG: polysaccharide biosynthesis PFTS motif protein [Thermodesulfovibrionia bacterium]|nr:polysaccharide biosynthesis PFTS motif protein [Thermodesulfovibrionia bacterium]